MPSLIDLKANVLTPWNLKGTKKLVFLSLLITMGLILGLLEQSLPVLLPVPGAKLGLANIVVVTTLFLFGLWNALIVAVIRSLLLMAISGSVSSLFFSLSGAILSVLVMGLLYDRYYPKFSILGISIAGALFHNLAQVVIAAVFIQSLDIFIYYPFLMVISIPTGLFVGAAAYFTCSLLKKIKAN